MVANYLLLPCAPDRAITTGEVVLHQGIRKSAGALNLHGLDGAVAQIARKIPTSS
jgi:hypothetical protein